MARTKLTPRTEGHRCPMCSSTFPTKQEWDEHIVECAEYRRVKRYNCETCSYGTNKRVDLARHRASQHPELRVDIPQQEEDQSDWERQNPGSLVSLLGGKEGGNDTGGPKGEDNVVESDLVGGDLVGRIIRKATCPAPPKASLKRKVAAYARPAPPKTSLKRKFAANTLPMPLIKLGSRLTAAQGQPSCADEHKSASPGISAMDPKKGGDEFSDSASGVQVPTGSDGLRCVKRRKLVSTVATYQVDGKTVKEITETEEWFQ